MKKYVIISDTCCDLNKNLREKYNIDYAQMGINYEDKEFPASLDWEYISVDDFYNLMKKGIRVKTTQVKKETYVEKFEEYLKQGYDILSISCSSKLSGSYHTSVVIKDELLKKYPDCKIICIDSKNSSMGLGLLCITASRLREEGKTLDETAKYIVDHLNEMNQLCTVDDLSYLKRAGRVSTMSAVFGGLLQVKPIIISDVHGYNASIEKVKGRKNSLVRIADMFKEIYQDDHPYQMVCVSHAVCKEDAQTLVDLIKERMPKVEIIDSILGPIIGASTGPGTVVCYCYGKEVTFDSERK